MAWTMVVTPCYTLRLGGAEHVRNVAPKPVNRCIVRSADGHRHSAPCLPSMGSAPEPQGETMRAPAGPQNATLAAVCCLGLLARACAGLFGDGDSRAGLSCIDDSPECVEQRQATLKSMLADKDRKWVKEPPTPQAHASGVRLFAFRSRKKELSCEELAHRAPRGRQRAEGAARARRQEPVTGADLPRHHVRRRGQQGARRRDADAPLQGLGIVAPLSRTRRLRGFAAT